MSDNSVVGQLSNYLGDDTEVGAYFDSGDSTPVLSTEIGDYRTGESVGKYVEDYLSEDRSMIIEFKGDNTVRFKYNSSTGRVSIEYSGDDKNFELEDYEVLDEGENGEDIARELFQDNEPKEREKTAP